MPPSKFSRGTFSFGECARQSGSASPTSKVSMPRMPRNCDTIGMLPPSRMSATSWSKALRNARRAASPRCECGSVRYHAPKLRHDRDAAALAYERDIVVEGFAQRAACGFAEVRMRIGEVPWAAVAGDHFHRDTFRQIFP